MGLFKVLYILMCIEDKISILQVIYNKQKFDSSKYLKIIEIALKCCIK